MENETVINTYRLFKIFSQIGSAKEVQQSSRPSITMRGTWSFYSRKQEEDIENKQRK